MVSLQEKNTPYLKNIKDLVKTNKKVVYLGIATYFVLFICIRFLIFFNELLIINYTPYSVFYEHTLKKPIDIFSMYLFIFLPFIEGDKGYIINYYIYISLIPSICISSFITSFITKNRSIGESISTLALVILLISTLASSLIMIAIYFMIGEFHFVTWIIVQTIFILPLMMLPLAILHIILGDVFSIIGSKIRT